MISYIDMPDWLTPYRLTQDTISYRNLYKLCTVWVSFDDSGDVGRVRVIWDLPEEQKDVTYSGEGSLGRAILDLACWDLQFAQQVQDLDRRLEEDRRLARLENIKYIGLPLVLVFLALLALSVYTWV